MDGMEAPRRNISHSTKAVWLNNAMSHSSPSMIHSMINHLLMELMMSYHAEHWAGIFAGISSIATAIATYMAYRSAKNSSDIMSEQRHKSDTDFILSMVKRIDSAMSKTTFESLDEIAKADIARVLIIASVFLAERSQPKQDELKNIFLTMLPFDVYRCIERHYAGNNHRKGIELKVEWGVTDWRLIDGIEKACDYFCK